MIRSIESYAQTASTGAIPSFAVMGCSQYAAISRRRTMTPTVMADGTVNHLHCPECGCSDLRLAIRDVTGINWPITHEAAAKKNGIYEYTCDRCYAHFDEPLRSKSLLDFEVEE